MSCRTFTTASILALVCLMLVEQSEQMESRCELPEDPGYLCFRRWLLRFYYNTEEKRCMGTLWGGCGGNANRFDSFEECEQHCT
ncbi:hypothetical protein EG68_08600 [Paragonimus skrjabini miyazakii]|uniref:BPTI/Kunitz inhibitor domain-containing protein n=1 Tax=Paragonimus skrjabini miyazakii TaxID=59628 RepID=A0A8S9YMN1_9TREM|nr:hypothetical protein EG68_08600 [Paragonimus skrjabini miyazakii]